MKKKSISHIFFPLLFVAFIFSMTSCEKEQTFAKKLKIEQNAINQFIRENNYKILTKFPKDGKFENNELFKLPSGVYFQITQKGEPNDSIHKDRNVYIRYDECITLTKLDRMGNLIPGNDTIPGNDYLSDYPISFQYGNPQSEPAIPGLAEPLPFITELAELNVLVPMELNARQRMVPSFYKGIVYRFNEVPGK